MGGERRRARGDARYRARLRTLRSHGVAGGACRVSADAGVRRDDDSGRAEVRACHEARRVGADSRGVRGVAVSRRCTGPAVVPYRAELERGHRPGGPASGGTGGIGSILHRVLAGRAAGGSFRGRWMTIHPRPVHRDPCDCGPPRRRRHVQPCDRLVRGHRQRAGTSPIPIPIPVPVPVSVPVPVPVAPCRLRRSRASAAAYRTGRSIPPRAARARCGTIAP